MTTTEKLEAIANNLWWTWTPRARKLFKAVHPEAFAAAGNSPLAALRAADSERLSDPELTREVDAVYEAFNAYMKAPAEIDDAPETAYFCMEYGLHESMPLYSGGLGVLAGDHTKAAADLGLPFTAVGLLLREGYFHQSFDEKGNQQANYPPLDPEKQPLSLVTNPDVEPLRVSVPIGGTSVQVQAWEAKLGHVSLYLLDTDHEGNPEPLRGLTRRLYQGGDRERIRQELVLGVGGLRLLRALGNQPDVYHANEGHCAFLMFELMREHMETGTSHAEAEAAVRDSVVFTTHTPVPAGHDRFAPDLFTTEMAGYASEHPLDVDELAPYGRVDPDDETEEFVMTVLGLNLSRAANGVSKINGRVAQQQWQDMYPDRDVEEVPIGSITNGVHLPTWTAAPARDFIAANVSGDWARERQEQDFWAPLGELDDATLWAYRCKLRERLLNYAADHVERQSLTMEPNLDPDALTIGFARRFATYKRAPLIFTDIERARKLFADGDRPIQILFAGKAHPDDEGGQAFIKRIYQISQETGFKGRVLMLENYNMETGRMLVSGSDVWLNNPRRPMEASGTSGQKIAAHGGLNLSVLDGWWPEGYNGENGWAIGPEATGVFSPRGPEGQKKEDARDAESLYTQLETSVVPDFYNRNADGIPTAWVSRMRDAMTGLPAPFSAKRMVIDYVNTMYRQPVEQV
ncbi:MAG: alpha-glucan family phosphorylase [Longimonas sp.]|uniref:alpha-glucan family phosphorylase n=1 Tax=Longimonas sp. TaxID=2039626 RepID=UPI00335C444E